MGFLPRRPGSPDSESPHGSHSARRTARAASLAGLAGGSAALVAVAVAAGTARADPPAGPTTADVARARGGARACSPSYPLCVHAGSTADAPSIAAVLRSAERQWAAITDTLRGPRPGVSADGWWHVYLVDSVDGGGTAAFDARDPLARLDRASSFALVDRAAAASPGCGLDLALARAIARAAIWRAAPGTDEGTARAESDALARLASPCAGAGGDDEAFQAEPERTIVDPRWPAFDRGASAFFTWLDRTFGARPGALLVGLWATAPTKSPPGAPDWARTPSTFDVLRVSLKDALGSGSTLDDVIARFAVARWEMTPAPRVAWHLPWPAAARRVASPRPVAPTGASYVVIDRAGAPPGAKLRVEAEWEDYGRMRWIVAKLDAAGRTLAELPVTSLDKGTRASMTIEGLEGADRVLVVGVNVGNTEHPFDPAQGEWEPHGWLLTVAAE
jgi:hypothetical protein